MLSCGVQLKRVEIREIHFMWNRKKKKIQALEQSFERDEVQSIWGI